MSRLLVSVRSVDEVEAALEGGADLIDIKEPSRGSLGRADDEVVRAIVERVAGRRPVSAARGDLRSPSDEPLGREVEGLAYLKWGLAEMASFPWRERLDLVWKELGEIAPSCEPVLTAYADWERAKAPAPWDAFNYAACDSDYGGHAHLLIDTFHKDGSTVLDWMSVAELADIASSCSFLNAGLAVAGSLNSTVINQIRERFEPDWFAVRGAACVNGDRDGTIDVNRVRALAQLVHS